MDLQQIEQEALLLSREELREVWLQEAVRRAGEVDEMMVSPIPGSAVLSRARALVEHSSSCSVVVRSNPR